MTINIPKSLLQTSFSIFVAKESKTSLVSGSDGLTLAVSLKNPLTEEAIAKAATIKGNYIILNTQPIIFLYLWILLFSSSPLPIF
jgi:hypothetical protein